LYARDDTMFNESFATAVERLGGALWFAGPGSDAARAQFGLGDERRRAFRSLVVTTRSALQAIYARSATVDAGQSRAQKAAAMQDFRDRYAALKQGWGGFSGYDKWVADANNASLGAQAAYDELVPQFEALFKRHGRDWHAFYDAARRIADLPAAERRRALAAAGE
jgi:predicted aminopeptidase